MEMKIEKDDDNCCSVLAACDCCDSGWHWTMTSMGPDAENHAKEWMENMSKITF